MRIIGRKHEKEIEETVEMLAMRFADEIEKSAEHIGTTGEIVRDGVTRKLSEVFNVA